MLTHQHKLEKARERFGRPFANQPGTDWKPNPVPFLVRYRQERLEPTKAANGA